MPTSSPHHPKIGYLCTYVPEEIIHAAGFLPVRILPDTSPATLAAAHLQSYTCGLARSCLNRALTGKLDSYAGVVLAHSCDTMQGLADIWRASFPGKFVETVVSPVALNSPHARAYLVAELRRFAARLEQYFAVKIGQDALAASIRLYNAHRQTLSQFYAERESFTAVEWFMTMRNALEQPPDALHTRPVPPQSARHASRARIAVIGSTMDEPTLAQIIDELGARLVADDLCTGARYLDTLVAEQIDPFQAIADRMLSRLPCPCKHHSLDTRQAHLTRLVQDHRVQGVIFYLKKFCDPHAWDYVPLARALDDIHVPHLLLETEQATPAGQTRVRVEAFLEMLEA